jgi:hypothetical protein
MSCTASRTVPEVGRSSPAAQCSNVLLPDPDGPVTAVKEYRPNSTLTSSRSLGIAAGQQSYSSFPCEPTIPDWRPLREVAKA